MRIFIVLICSLALALGNAIAQQPQDKKQNKKGAPSKQGAPQGTKPVGKPQGYKPAGPPPKTAEYGKAKGRPQPAGEYGKVKGKGQPMYANKPAEASKAKGKAGAPNAAVAGKPGKAGVAVGKPHKAQHFNLPKQPNTAKAPPVKFQQGRHIEGSQNWQGQRYAAFRDYHAEWHDQSWWHSHYHNNIVFVFGAPYYWNAGYWFPAWGYYPNAYYAWDGPIYAYNHLPPDQVIANVQSALQQQGYYSGDVDGLIGPVTRAALADYQRDHGLYETAAIDQPTLESLGMA
jgi:hypothetical protein